VDRTVAGVVVAVHTPEAPHGGRRASAHCLAPHPTLDPARAPGEEGADREGSGKSAEEEGGAPGGREARVGWQRVGETRCRSGAGAAGEEGVGFGKGVAFYINSWAILGRWI
jgi:hypothetical protein